MVGDNKTKSFAMRRLVVALFFCMIISLATISACNIGDDSSVDTDGNSTDSTTTTSETRSFNLGFTTWPYAADMASLADIYEKVTSSTYGDIVGLHYMDGIPWVYGNDAIYPPENLGPLYTNATQNYVQERVVGTAPISTMYLAIDSINGIRTGIAEDIDNGTTPGYLFNHTSAKFAYTNFALYALYTIYDHYSSNNYALPNVYFNYGSEATDLIVNSIDPTNDGYDYLEWNEFVSFGNYVYTTLKNYTHTNADFQTFVRSTTLMVSVALKSPKDEIGGNLSRWDSDANKYVPDDKMEVIEGKFGELHDYIDMVGISSYGYAFYDDQYTGVNGSFEDVNRGDPDTLPSNWLSQITSISGNKLLGITETGWIAQDYHVAPSYIITSDETRQNAFVTKLFSESESLGVKFIVWYTLVDYDPLWDTFGADKPAGLTWRNTGLYDISPHTDAEYKAVGATLTARAAWTTWTNWLSRNRSSQD